MTQDKSGWDLSKLQNLFDDATIQAILNIPKWNTTQRDQWIWRKNFSGSLTVKSAYKEAINLDLLGPFPLIWGKIWKSHLHERLKMHLW
jgi:hypothetical protein